VSALTKFVSRELRRPLNTQERTLGTAPAVRQSVAAIARIAVRIVKALFVIVLATTVLLSLAVNLGVIRWERRSRQLECRANLRHAITAELAFIQEMGRHSERIEEIGFQPERGNRYAYFLSEEGPLQRRADSTIEETSDHTGIGVDLFKYGPGASVSRGALPRVFAGGARLGITGNCSAWDPRNRYDASSPCAMTIACAGQIDKDPTLDIWSISTAVRWTAEGEEIPAGQPYCEVNDHER
jgi:hypothetical protein